MGGSSRRAAILAQGQRDERTMTESDAGEPGHAPAPWRLRGIDGSRFPDIGAGRVLLAVKATDFEMGFPAARVRTRDGARA